jgi:hypothetical protein
VLVGGGNLSSIIVDSRKEVRNECFEHIKLIDLIHNKPAQTQEEIANLKHHISKICKKVNNKYPSSALAIDCTRHYQNTYSWMQRIFPTLCK